MKGNGSMADTERHVKRFVFGRLLPVRGVDHVWERRYGWHWVVEEQRWLIGGGPRWNEKEWLYDKRRDRPLPKIEWPEPIERK